MRRRRSRSTPWIQKWSRVIIGAIATLGLILTTYLTITALSGEEVLCNASGADGSSCASVLSSPYATVFGQPLSLFGALAYLSMIIFALSPYLISEEEKPNLRNTVEDWTKLFLLIGATAMTIFSGYLMYILAVKIVALCYYCIGSALFALSMLVLTIVGQEWDDIGQAFTAGIIVIFVTFIGTLAIYDPVNNPVAADGLIPEILTPPEEGIGWPIATTSTESEIALAEHLTASDIKMYGAYWCPHCRDQKNLFGKEAFKEVTYIECAADATKDDPQPEKCEAAGVQSYPTWEIDGELQPGQIPLDQLAERSGYDGPDEFKYRLR
ncbi:MAG: vitamin K epoxide reductase family protein [Spirulina sp. SIO3F2]|nr:vitamin K epoxide reductase family protein [Spirulina sp. SIO3F2]